MERTVRKYKRRALTEKAAGADDTASRAKLGEWQAKLRDFTKQTDLRRDYNREYIGVKSGESQPKGLNPGANGVLKDTWTKPADISNLPIIKVENKIGEIDKGKPMTFGQADGGKVNPGYNKTNGCNTNCQSAVATLKARLNGFNVITKPNYNNPMAKALSYQTNIAFIDKKTGTYPQYIKPKGKTAKDVSNWLNNNLIVNNKYTIEFTWKGVKTGHILTIWKTKNNLILYDPQKTHNYTRRGIDEIEKYLKETKMKSIKLLNIDNCDLNESVCKEIMELK